MPDYRCAGAGNFYAVGIGPGASDLLTLRAACLIETADIIIAPRSSRSETSLALECVREHITTQHIIEHIYPMRRNLVATMESWSQMATRIIQMCQQGKSVVQITIGDPLIYSTSCYLLSCLEEKLPADHIHVIPGISAFQASACSLNMKLLLQEDRMTLMPGTDLQAVAEALDHCEMLVLYKVSRVLPQLRDLLRERGLLDNAGLACYVEQNGRELLIHDLRKLPANPPGYMATLLVRTGDKTW